MRRISIFGATGSIGQNTLDLIRRQKDSFHVVALTGGQNIDQLALNAREFGAEIAVTAFDQQLPRLKRALQGSGVEAAAGAAALIEAAARPADWTMSAIVGSAGLAPGLAAAARGGTLALANKETLVCAGRLFLDTARKGNTTVIPVDSEHSAIFQALVGEDIATVERIIITASGGPFRDWPVARLAHATLGEALNHPNWSMGQRITIDSASLFNKALELIETKEFFGVAPDQVEVLVHPESLVHALVGFRDGALMAHLGAPDMRHAIGFALNWPTREPLPVERLDLARAGQLRFEAPDPARFPAIRLAREVMNIGGLAGAAFNAAKERALDAFIASHIGFLEMAEIVEATLDHLLTSPGLIDDAITLDTVTNIDNMARIRASELINARSQKGA